MSDQMLLGALRMPYDMAMRDEIARHHFHGRAKQAADRIESDGRRIADLEVALAKAAQPVSAGLTEPKLCDYGNQDEFDEAHDDWERNQRYELIGAMEYNGNTVSYMYSKAKNYGNVLVECCNIIGGTGDIRDRILGLLAERDALLSASQRNSQTIASECKCTFAQRMAGDGCDICNPSLALEHAKDRIAELEVTLGKAQEDAKRYRFLAADCRKTSEHWGGRWSIVIDGPAPEMPDREEDFDASIDAAMRKTAQPEGRNP